MTVIDFPTPDAMLAAPTGRTGTRAASTLTSVPPAMTEAEATLLAWADTNPTPRPTPARDRYGRYKLPHPTTGKPYGWTRVTTMAKTLADTYTLEKWAQRKVLTGVTLLRPDLAAAAATVAAMEETPDTKGDLDAIADLAKETAGAHLGAALGTAMHTATEHHDLGTGIVAPAPWDHEVAIYAAALDADGLTRPAEWIERIVIQEHLGCAGTLDRIVVDTETGLLMIGDYKSAKDITYGLPEIAIQLAIYANSTHMWNGDTNTYEPMPPVSTERALVFWQPIGSGTCTVLELDITVGWEMAQVCRRARDWRTEGKKIAKERTVYPGTGGNTGTPAAGTAPAPAVALSVVAEAGVPTPPASARSAAPQAPPPAAVAEAAGTQDTPRPAVPAPSTPGRAEWLTNRLTTLRDAHPQALQALAARWPAGVPTGADNRRTGATWTDDHIDAIADALVQVEAAADAPFGPLDPNQVAAIEADKQAKAEAKAAELAARDAARDATATTLAPTWDPGADGGPAGADLLAAMREAFASIDNPDATNLVKRWATDGRNHGHPFAMMPPGLDFTVRHVTIAAAAIAAATELADDLLVRNAIAFVTGVDLAPTWLTGCCLGALSADQAAALGDLCAAAAADPTVRADLAAHPNKETEETPS